MTQKDGFVPIYEWSFTDDRHLQSESARTKFVEGSERELQIVAFKPMETNELNITFYHACKFSAVSKLEVYHEPNYEPNPREPPNRWSRKS